MQQLDDMALLREYATRNSEAAFETLVSRRVHFVYSAAMRQARDPHLAEEITQAVFIILAQKAGKISDKTILTGWLFKTTRFAALAQTRAVIKRKQREQEAQMQSQIEPSAPDLLWEQMSPLLDEALAQLGEKDRQAVLLRFFENKNLAEVGNRLGTGEDTARKRVSRALEKLRNYFSKRGVVSTTAIIAGMVSANSIQAAPPGMAATVAATAAKGFVVGGSTLTLIKGAMKIMAWTKAKLAIGVGVGVLLTAGTTVVVVKTVSPSEPSYQGKLLSDWTKDFFQRTAKGYTISRGGEAADAIQHMGKKAIPTLLKMVSSQKPFDNATNSFAFQQQAAGGFWALGPVAESAIPELAKFVNQPKHAPGAAKSLAGISPKAVEPLIRALNNTNANVRVFVASALGQGFEPPHADPNISISPRTPPLGSDVTATIAALIQCTKDTDKTVRAVASSALGKIGKEPEIVIPVLIEMLSDDEREGRRMAAQSLGFFGKEARVAIPSLTTATNDSDSNVQRLAQQALKRIEIGVSYQSPAFK